MATTTVDTEQIGAVYSNLMGKVSETLDTQWDLNRITGDNFAKVLESSIMGVLNISAQTVADLPIKDAQAKLIEAQIETEKKKALLTVRQTSAYNDNLRVEEAKSLANVTGMFGAGGTALPTDLETKMFDAVAAITP